MRRPKVGPAPSRLKDEYKCSNKRDGRKLNSCSHGILSSKVAGRICLNCFAVAMSPNRECPRQAMGVACGALIPHGRFSRSVASTLECEPTGHLERGGIRLGTLDIGELVHRFSKPRVIAPAHDHHLQVG